MIGISNIFYFIFIFFILCCISVFPNFSQTKKNLLWLVFIFIITSILMIIDFGIEFLPLAYLLIYVGAVAVMFLFVIVAVDSKSENRIEVFEPFFLWALILNNFLSSIGYFFFISARGSSLLDMPVFLKFKENAKFMNFDLKSDLISGKPVCESCKKGDMLSSFYSDFISNSGCLYDNLSLYHLVEYRAKDIFVFSEYFFNYHGFLLVMVGFILTCAMLVSLLIAKDFAKKAI